MTLPGLAASAGPRGESIPTLGCWFWHEAEFEGEGYKRPIDTFAEFSPYELLTTSLRAPLKEVTDPEVRGRIARAAEYARKRGLGLVMDLDVRLAREAFRAAYPDELQEKLWLVETAATARGEVRLEVASVDLSDHYTFATTHYVPLAGRVARVYSYRREEGEILPDTVEEVPSGMLTLAEVSEKRVSASFQEPSDWAGRTYCLLAAFTHLTPDVFAPHLDEFQRGILESYSNVPLAGVCKDEWGFPPSFEGNPRKNEFYYSEARAKVYADRTGGRDLLRDLLLMAFGEKGRERDRQAAINRFMSLSTDRNTEIETQFYKATKEIFGATAFVGTHPTWFPYPDSREIEKNGLSWWGATRDWAQTDEGTPYSCRTALSKKWNSPVWFNMFYDREPEVYEKQVWSDVLAGGRMNIHPLYPFRENREPFSEYTELMTPELVLAQRRISLLNAITKSPLNCPIAVIFGHACAMNWAGPGYADTGEALARHCWKLGYPADLIPTTEIGTEALRVTDAGKLVYGPQEYDMAILFQPEFEDRATAQFFRRVDSSQTLLYRVGEWTRDFEGELLSGTELLPHIMKVLDRTAFEMSSVIQDLVDRGIPPQTGATQAVETLVNLSRPPQRGHAHLIDGTFIFISAEDSVAGDPFRETFQVKGQKVEVEAAGLVAFRFSQEGDLEALAAGGLKRFAGGGVGIALENPADLALWRGKDGEWEGLLLNRNEPIPQELLEISRQWEVR
jgi:hypothetical protein